MKKILLALSAAAVATPALALEPLDGSTGWSGFINLGAGAGQVESNFLAELSGFNIDLGDKNLDTAGSPDSEDVFIPVLAGQVSYTFSNKVTSLSLGNDFADHVNFDRSSALTLHHEFGKPGIVEATFLNASAVETRVWEDPYLVGSPREDTEMAVSGFRVVWDRIFGTEFEARISTRERDLDNEKSGEGLGLSAADQKLLDRNGDINQLEVSYKFKLNEQNTLRPHVRYIDRDLDGDAMSQDGTEVGVTHEFTSNEIRWKTQLAYASLDGDADNPIFGDANDTDRIVFSSVMFFPGFFGLDKWVPNVGFIFGDEDSDVYVNDSTTWMVNAAIYRRF